LNILIFELGSDRYAVVLEQVIEVLPVGPITPVPTISPLVFGAVNVRGHVTPVVDLRELFKAPKRPPRPGDMSLLILCGGIMLMLGVDRVLEAISIPDPKVETSRLANDLIRHRLETPRGMARLIDLERMLASISSQIASATTGSLLAEDLPLIQKDNET
jgi:chemotaxis signal transduction protein